MNKIGLIIRREYLTRVRKRSFLIMTFLGPILMAAIYIIPIMLALNSSNENMRIAVVDESHWFENRFQDNKEHTFVILPGQPIDSVKNLVKENIFDMALYVPPTQLNIPSNAIVYSIRQVPMEVETYISRVMQKEIEDQKLMANGVDPEIVSAVKTDVNLSIMRMDEKGNEKETFTKVQFTLGIALAMLVYMFIIFFGGQVMQGVAEEKTNRIIEVIVSSVKPFQLMMGKIIGVSLVALTQFVLWIVLTGALYLGFSAFMGLSNPEMLSSGTVMAQQISNENVMNNESVQSILQIVHSIDFGTIIATFLIFFILGYLLYATLYAAIGSLVDNNTDAQQFTLPVTVPLIVAIISSFYIVNNPDSSLSVWLSMIPFTSPISMMVRIPFGVPIWQIVLSIVLLAGTFVLMTWIAAKIYRTGILMYGKKLSYKEIFKWLKYK
ncbi:MAG: ABC transporter permease [bacterium]|jgi:ABC-2 type transport system permease protein|nr:MAG: ABC-2 type transport system permease protein [bacterium F083]MDO5316565.1 ABC transporter permease [bacterium]